MKKLISLLLILTLALSLCACDAIDYYGKIEGTWTLRYKEDDQLKQDLLEGIELFDEEIELVEAQLYGVKTVTFNSDKAFSFSEPVKDNKACVREFFEEMFADLYAGKENLDGLYDVDLSTLDQDDFLQFYADLYGAEDYEGLLDMMADNAYDYSMLGVTKTGTYTVGSKYIKVDTEGTENDGTIEYKVDGDTLTLKFSDGTEVYKKAS